MGDTGGEHSRFMPQAGNGQPQFVHQFIERSAAQVA